LNIKQNIIIVVAAVAAFVAAVGTVILCYRLISIFMS